MISYNELSPWLKYAVVLSIFWGTINTIIGIYYMLLFL